LNVFLYEGLIASGGSHWGHLEAVIV